MTASINKKACLLKSIMRWYGDNRSCAKLYCMYICTVPTHVLMHTFSLTRIVDSVGIHTRIHYNPLGSSGTAISHMQKRRAPRHANIETKLSSGSDGTRERFASASDTAAWTQLVPKAHIPTRTGGTHGQGPSSDRAWTGALALHHPRIRRNASCTYAAGSRGRQVH